MIRKSLFSTTLAALILSFAGSTGLAQMGAPSGPREGQKAPDFAIQDLEGKTWQLSELRGKPVLLMFWTTWCPACKQIMPQIIDYREQYKDEEFVILSILGDDDKSPVTSYLSKNDLPFPHIWDEDDDLFRKYGAVYIPTFYLIGRDGTVVAAKPNPGGLDQMVKLLVEKGDSAVADYQKEMAREEALLDEASEKYQWGDYEGFLAKLKEFKEKFPDSPRMENIDAAIKQVSESLGIDPEEAGAEEETKLAFDVGDSVGEVTFEDSKGNTLTIPDEPEEPVVLFFWSANNKLSIQQMAQMVSADAPEGVRLVMVNLDADVEGVPADLEMPESALAFEGGFDAEIARKFGIDQLPSSAFITTDGILIARNLYGERFDQGVELITSNQAAELNELHQRDELEREIISKASEAWKNDEKGRYYQTLKSFLEHFPDSPYAPRIEKLLEKQKAELGQYTIEPVLVGDMAPDFRLLSVRDRDVRLAHYVGKPLLLTFWEPRSMPCMAQLPVLNRLYDGYDLDQLGIVAIAAGATREEVEEALEACPVEFPVLVDEEKDGVTSAMRYSVKKVPATFLINRKGQLVAQDLGGASLEKAVELLVQADGDALDEFLAQAREARQYLAESEQIFREQGERAYYKRLETFLTKYPNAPEAEEVRAFLEKRPFQEPDLTAYGALVGKKKEIDQIRRDFRILQWAMAEYHANNFRFPKDLKELASDSEELDKRIRDPFGNDTYRYYTDGESYWIILSNGPDGDADINEVTYAGDEAAILSREFDPDMGTMSDGDLFLTGRY